MIIAAITIILVLAGLIFFHELGHFAVARLFGMGVSTFSLGFGPRLCGTTIGKTEYRISAVPLGGYVSLVGENDDDERPERFTEEEDFSKRPPWQRLLVVAAGPLANLILAWFICWGLAYTHGEADLLPNIGGVEEAGPAAQAGIMAGDVVLSVDGREVTEWKQVADSIAQSNGVPMNFTLLRGKEAVKVRVVPQVAARKTIFGEDENVYRIGIRASGQFSTRELGFIDAASSGWDKTFQMASLTWQGMVKLVQRVVPLDQVGGPILIAQMVSREAHEGASNVLALMALISINLAILNLLPIPVLDGGHILFFSLEMIMRRPLSVKLRTITTQAGFAFLIGLMVLATFNDLWRIFQGFGK